MGVSKNRGTPKWMVYNGKPYKKGMIWAYHYFWKRPYIRIYNYIYIWNPKIEVLEDFKVILRFLLLVCEAVYGIYIYIP